MTTDIFMDCETVGINPMYDCVIEAYFYIDDANSFHLKCRPDRWSYEAQEIHQIPEHVAMSYPDKKTAFRDLLKWLPKDFRFISHANKNTELGFINFDTAILVNELNLLGCKNYYLENEYQMKPNITTHKMARDAAANKLFAPITGAQAYRLGITSRESAKSSNRQSLALGSIYYALFGELPSNSHNAKDDVLALVRIYKELVRLLYETSTRLI